MTSIATIFYVDEQELRGDDNPFGVRFESQILPRGSVVVGFMQWNDQTRQIDELLISGGWPLRANQESAWNEVVEEARKTLRGENNG